MNELLVDRLKKARAESGLKQQDVAAQLGLKANTISNWEKGRTEPDIDSFVKLCDIYDVDCATLLSDVYAFKRIGTDISLSEFDHIKKYRSLDPAAQSHVDSVLDWEVERSSQLLDAQKQIIELKNQCATLNNFPLKEESTPYTLNAAHERTDIPDSERTPELAQIEENIMDDDNF